MWVPLYSRKLLPSADAADEPKVRAWLKRQIGPRYWFESVMLFRKEAGKLVFTGNRRERWRERYDYDSDSFITEQFDESRDISA